MNVETREFVRRRAAGRCEYCRIPDRALILPFHVEHIVASIHKTDDSLENLAWACPRCNLRKGTNLTTIDPETTTHVSVFHPRTMSWDEHFAIRDGIIVRNTSCGRGMVRLLDMNNENRLQHRRRLIDEDAF